MRPLKLNMSKFHKVSGDAQHTVMRHQDGHEIRVAHKALSPEAAKQLTALPAKDEESKAQRPPKDGAAAKREKSVIKDFKGMKMAGGGEIPGGPGSPAIDQDAAKKSDEYYSNHPHEGVREMWENMKKAFSPTPEPTPKAQKMADGGDVKPKNGPPEIKKKDADEFSKGFNDPDPIVRKVKEVFGMYEGGPAKSVEDLDLNQTASPAPQQMPVQPQQPVINVTVGGGQPPMSAPPAAGAPSGNPSGPNPAPVASPITNPAELMRAMSSQLPPLSDLAQQGFANASPMQAEAIPQSLVDQNNAKEDQLIASTQPLSGAPSPSQGIAQSATEPPNSAQAAASDPYGYAEQAKTLQDAVQQQLGGLKHQADAQAKIAADEQKALEANQQGMQTALTRYTDADKDIQGHIDSTLKAIDEGSIDPNRFWAGKSLPGKISTIFGLILGSGGAALAGQENLAFKSLQNNIDRDIDSQKANLGKKNTLLEAYYHKLGNMRDATEMTRVMLNAAALNDLKLAAAKQGAPMAKAAYDQIAGKTAAEYAPTIAQIKRSQAMIGLMGDAQQNPDHIPGMLNGLRQIDPEKAKEIEARYVPHVGLANVPVSGEVRAQLLARQQLAEQARKLYSWAQKNSGSLDPKVIAEGQAMSAELQSGYRGAINGGVYKKGEQEFIDTIVDSDPTKFFNKIRVLPKLKAVILSNDAQFNTLKRSVGLPEGQSAVDFSPQQKVYLDWAHKNPQDPRAKLILNKLLVR